MEGMMEKERDLLTAKTERSHTTLHNCLHLYFSKIIGNFASITHVHVQNYLLRYPLTEELCAFVMF